MSALTWVKPNDTNHHIKTAKSLSKTMTNEFSFVTIPVAHFLQFDVITMKTSISMFSAKMAG
jgi:hypothetical protein